MAIFPILWSHIVNSQPFFIQPEKGIPIRVYPSGSVHFMYMVYSQAIVQLFTLEMQYSTF